MCERMGVCVCVCEATSQCLLLIQPSLYCDRLFKNHKMCVCVAPEEDACVSVFAFVCLDKAHRPGM